MPLLPLKLLSTDSSCTDLPLQAPPAAMHARKVPVSNEL